MSDGIKRRENIGNLMTPGYIRVIPAGSRLLLMCT